MRFCPWARAFVVIPLLLVADHCSGQYMYLDSNGDGLNDSSDRLSANGTPATVDVYLVTNQNRDGSPAACNSDTVTALDVFSYVVHLRASNGTATYSNFIDRTGFETKFDSVTMSDVVYKNGRGGSTLGAGGPFRLFTLTITGQSGTPEIAIVDGFETPIFSGEETSFGSSCSGGSADYTYRMDGPVTRSRFGSGDWFDADGVSGAGGGSGLSIEGISPSFLVADQTTRVTVRGRGLGEDVVLRLHRNGQQVEATNVSAEGDAILTGDVVIPQSMVGSLSATVTRPGGEYAGLNGIASAGDLYWGIGYGDNLLASGRVGSGIPLWTGSEAAPARAILARRGASIASETDCDRIPYCSIPINNIFGFWFPSIDLPNRCEKRPEFVSSTLITYFLCYTGPCTQSNPNKVKGLPVGIEIHARGWTGWHCHSDANRPNGSPDSAIGDTGDDGLGFRIDHRWPDVAGALNIVFYSRADTFQFNRQRDTTQIYCIHENTFYELNPGPGYNLIGARTPHPENHWGKLKTIEALKETAKDIQENLPEANPLFYNDISLPSGGLYDWKVAESASFAWKRPHCSHRNGDQIDLRIWHYESNALLDKLEARLQANGFHVYREDEKHWHITYLHPN